MPRWLRRAPAAVPALAPALVLALASVQSAEVLQQAPALGPASRPRLVVLIVVDMLRADLLTRFEDLFLPARSGGAVGGFRWLMEEGAWFRDARHDHFPPYTAVGHAAIVTGALPYQHGIVGNRWFDRALGRVRDAVEDPDSPVIGPPEPNQGVSPASMRAGTIGDEMKIATGGRAKVWAVAVKDRSAVLMAGRLADGAVWFDTRSGSWATSRFYVREGAAPAWLLSWNGLRGADRRFGETWIFSAPAEAIARLWTPTNREADDARGLGAAFPHRVDGGLEKPGRPFYRALVATPFADALTVEAAVRLIEAESLGQDEVPDLLAVSLSALDYAGEEFGPDSAEVLDVVVRADRRISGFLNDLDRIVPGGLRAVTVVLSADHGIAPIVAEARAAGLPAGFFREDAVRDAAEGALDAAYGPDDWTAALAESNLYLNLRTLARRKVPQDRAEEIAAGAAGRIEGIYGAYTASQILGGRLPATEIARRVSQGFHPRVSGEVVIVPDAYWVAGKHPRGAAHGAPYAYDTSVPILLAGAGTRPGRILEPATTLDIAPTIAALLGILRPSGSEGRVLSQALAVR